MLFAVVIILWAKIRPSVAPRTRTVGTWAEKFISLSHLVPLVVVVVIVLGGLYSGIFTATEVGAFGAGAALLIGVGALLAKRAGKR